MDDKLKIKCNGLSIDMDLSDASLVMGEPVTSQNDIRKLRINVAKETTQHNVMGYTTDIATMRLIFQNKTFRSSSLSNVNLNDSMERQRVGVSEFSSSRFITCFTHQDHECVPFWMNYGKNIRENKVLLQFKNFADNFSSCIRIDFAKVKDDKLCFFKSPQYGVTINGQWKLDTTKYDLRSCIDSINFFDVEYVPAESEVFTEDYSGQANVDLQRITGQENSVVNIQKFDPTVLGKQKSNPWEYEKETRILCTLSAPYFNEWDYIDLQLHSEMFRDLNIILSPWDDGSLKGQVEEIILSSGLPANIMDSIRIQDSVLKGTLNFQ